MGLLTQIMPPVRELFDMEPEEIGPYLLEYLNRQDDNGSKGILNRYNFSLSTNPDIRDYAQGNVENVSKILTEAWMWLEREGFIAPQPGEQGEWVFITRKGKKLRSHTDFNSYKSSYLLPSENLDPILLQKVRPLFIRGDYETAIFQSYKEVEVRLRKTSNLSDELVGVALAREAFNPEHGLLTDMTVVKSEREALMHLFAGSVGTFKNPTSHRNVNYSNPAEVAEIILFANYLLRFIDSRTSEGNK